MKVTGDGNLATKTPYLHQLDIGTEDACACVQVMDCVGSNLAENGSLVYTPDDHEIALGLSQQEGNLLSIGNDGRIFYDGSAPPPDDPCARTVESLPPFAVGGIGGAGGNNTARYTLNSYRQALDAKLDLTWVRPFILSDGTVAIAPFDSFARSGWYSEPVPVDPGGGADPALFAKPFNQMTAAAWRSCRIDYAGWLPSFGIVNTANWFETLSDLLEYTAGHIVYAISIDGSTMDSPDHLERLRSRVVESLVRRCLQRSAIIFSRDPARLVEAQAAGIDTGVVVDRENVGTVTPQAALAAGAKWACCTNGVRQATDIISWAQTKTYADAGLKTLAYGIMNRLDRNNAQDAGCVGFLGHDPIYAADDEERFGRGRADDWLFNGISPGQQAWRGANQGFFGTENTAGKRVDDRWKDGWELQQEAAFQTTSTLLGQFAPLPNDGQSYTLTWQFAFLSTPATTGKFMQLAFACPTDVPALEQRNPDDTTPNYPQAFSGYLARFYSRGSIELYRVDNGVQTQLGREQTGAAPSVGGYSRFTATVTATSIRLERSGTPAISVNDSTYRGHYLHAMKFGGTDPQRGGIRHLIIRS